MKPRALDLIVCPIDHTALELVEWESLPVTLSAEEMGRAERLELAPTLFSKEITTGVLLNRSRKIFYPIHQGIPRLLTFQTALTADFAKHYAKRIRSELPDFSMPHEMSTHGEDAVLRTFTSEWLNYDWNGDSYWSLTADAMYRCMRFMLDIARKPVKDKLVLEIGIGVGGIADYMARAEECELVGIDLSYAVDPAYKHFGNNPFLHIVQASAFAPPFKDSTFDFVYSQGVLHHTFSTKKAFQSICTLPKPEGRLYVWVYSPSNEQRTVIRRILMMMEHAIRPLCSRLPEELQSVVLLPIIPLYMLHQNLGVSKRTDYGYVKYGWREAMHAARDRFTPRYVHRHTEQEVSDWFQEAGYADIQCASQRDLPDFPPISLFVVDTAVDGVRRQSLPVKR